ncbi:AlpA family transcriptional regulator [Aliiruegeria haliotis]|uniref:AlpA family transcriptional regulator n=1 Tax=Aliiruegeria haliotis TaxID=1280846 RepID=A0A2T0RDQ1_9RHOB|nr:AlpA family phage regulatory protein [Aliiruegeria haliotis]PRY19292.1 AlpA family transcriptional regulator [Aliiruegeria haliotis]
MKEFAKEHFGSAAETAIPPDTAHSTAYDTVVSADQIAEWFGVTVGTVWYWNRSLPDFPKPFNISRRCTRWKKAEINDWFERCRTT